MNKFAVLLAALALSACTLNPPKPITPPKEALVAVAAQAPEPPKVVLPEWETSKLTLADKGKYDVIGKAYVVEGCQKDAVIAQLMTYLDAYRHDANGKPVTLAPNATTDLNAAIAAKCGAN